MNHRNNFDLLRLLAACQVVYMHCSFILHLPRGGYFFDLMSAFPGVACFFIISGFLVSKSYLDSTAPVYFMKRALRIYPALIVNIAVLELAMYLAGGFAQPFDWTRYPAYFSVYAATASDAVARAVTHSSFYMQGFFKGYPSEVLWTLTVELSFYLALPIALEFYKRSKPVGAIVLAAMMAGSYLLSRQFSEPFQALHPILNITTPPYFWVFGIGIVARLVWPSIKPLVGNGALLWTSIYLGVSFIAYLTIENPPGGPIWLEYKTQPSLIVVSRTCLLALALLSCAYSAPSASRWLRGTDLSYSIYLYHMLVVMTLWSFGFTGSVYLWPVVYSSAALIAWVSWTYVEKPALGWRQTIVTMGSSQPANPMASR